MPFFMDLHLVGKISVENVQKAHLADLAVQEKYGVAYHQYWYNEDAGTLFCLMEGPDAESCAATHLEAHGLSACQIVEVEGGMYEKFMGRDHKLDHGLVRRPDGEIDSGYRYIFTLNIIARTKLSDTVNIHQLKLPTIPIKTALSIIEKHGGKEVGTAGYDCIIAVFKDAVNSLDCAHEVQQEYLKSREIPGGDDFTFNMGISIGQPLTGTDGFFTRAIKRSQRLCLIAGDNEIITSRFFEKSCNLEKEDKERIGLRSLKPSQQDFLDNLLDIIENSISNNTFGVGLLSREIGVSQPQLYRKVLEITGRSPVSFIRDIRMNKALSLIKENKHNICQIAMEVGYNSPSYFSKCFQQKFGIKASRIAV
jgi:AraC-like DNA-binding protein